MGVVARGAGMLVASLIALPGCASTASTAPITNSPRALIDVINAATLTLTTRARFSESVSGSLISAAEVSGAGIEDFSQHKGSVDLRVSSGGVSVAVVYLSNVIYAKPPASTQWALPPATPWIFIDATGKDVLPTVFTGLATELEAANPSIPLAEVAWGASAAAANGTGADGITDYQVDVSLSAAASRAASLGDGVAALAIQHQITLGRGAALRFDVSVDRQGRVVALRGGSDSLLTTATTLSDFDLPVVVEAPPTDQTLDVATVGVGGESEKKKGADGDSS